MMHQLVTVVHVVFLNNMQAKFEVLSVILQGKGTRLYQKMKVFGGINFLYCGLHYVYLLCDVALPLLFFNSNIFLSPKVWGKPVFAWDCKLVKHTRIALFISTAYFVNIPFLGAMHRWRACSSGRCGRDFGKHREGSVLHPRTNTGQCVWIYQEPKYMLNNNLCAHSFVAVFIVSIDSHWQSWSLLPFTKTCTVSQPVPFSVLD